jgi:YXWGXW repeat-containing protein
MRYHAALVVSAFAAATALAPVPAYSAVDIDLNFGPPPVRVERVPPPRAGYIWAPGYWDYSGRHHVWRAGHWERARHGQRWHAGGWAQRDGRWHLDRGRWER